MKIHQSITERGGRALARTALVVTCAFAALVPFASSALAERSAAGPAPFKTLEEAVAAGKLDAALVRDLRKRGRAEGIVTVEYQEILNGAERGAPETDGRAEGIVDAIGPALAAQKGRALGQLKAKGRVVREYEFLPVSVAVFESAEELLEVVNAPEVTGIGPNRELAPALDESLSLIRQPLASASGYAGSGIEVAVIDTGVLLGNFGCAAAGPGCVISENLDFSENDSENMNHGTNVAGIVSGVAPGSRIIAMDVMFRNSQNADRAQESRILDALNAVIARRGQGRNIRAVNLSLGNFTTYFTSACSTAPGTSTTNPYTSVFSTLRRTGIVPVVAAMNDAFGMRDTNSNPTFTDGISYPACTPGALSVGAVYDDDVGSQTWQDVSRTTADCTDSTAADLITCFSQTGPTLKMLAPGALITAAGVAQWGTSMAAPHVAGAAAVLAAAKPDAPAGVIEQALANNGPRIVDTRPTPDRTYRRLDVCEALQGLLGRATARVTGFTLQYTAGACEANIVTVSLASGVYTITDTGAATNPDTGIAITAGTGCSQLPGSPNQVTCSASGISELFISTGDRNDTVAVTAPTRASVSGGPGDDTLNGGSANDTLAGDDGEDRLDGGGGNDVLRGGLDADVIRGGVGTDQADYATDVPGGRPAGVIVTIDDVANDGLYKGKWYRENDNVLTDVERLQGTVHNDTLTGSSASNIIWGSAGDDTLRGGGANDTLYGEAGVDSLYGEDGADTLEGGNEDDQLYGGVQGDVLRGGFGRDTLAGEDGGDFLDGGPGSAMDGLSDAGDTLVGGAGIDRATFSTHFTGVDVSLDGVANDGSTGEVDNVLTDVENVYGSPFADTLRGNDGANDLRGRNGNDTLFGGLGADWLYGEVGDDTLKAKGFFGDTDGRVDCGAGASDYAEVDGGDPVYECERLFGKK